MIPEKIGRYQIRSQLGRGGMAAVYRGFDPEFERDVAVKTLPREFLHDPDFRTRFRREARAIAALEHPAIVPVYDSGEENGQPYIVMRFMAGGSLTERLRRGPMPAAEAARIVSRLAPAIDEAHARGIIHRDLKPDNILFDQHNLPYIGDFGIAKLTESTGSITGSSLIGTPAYMSPEQARGERDIDGRSDIYALGAILYQMLTAEFPYKADTPVQLVMMHITQPVPRILDARPDLPPGSQIVIDRAMAKSRDQRFATAQAMADVLNAVARGETIPSMHAPPTTVVEPQRPAVPPTIVDSPPAVSAKTAVHAPSARQPSPPAVHEPQHPPPAPPAEAPRREIPVWIWGLAGLVVLALGVFAGLLIVAGPSALPGLLNLASDTAQPATAIPTATTAPTTAPTNTQAAPVVGPDLTATAAACSYAYALTGIDPPAGTPFTAGQPFAVTVMLANTGPCDWPKGMLFTLEKGDQLEAPPVIDVEPAAANHTGSVAIKMQAPDLAGTAIQVWALRLPDGTILGDPVELNYEIVGGATATFTPSATQPPVTKAPTATPTTAPTATAAVGGGPIAVRRVSFVSAARTGSGNDATATLSIEFTGGSGPFTITGDGIASPQVKNITGTFTDAGVTYSFIHFQRLTSCGASLPGTVNISDSAGRSASSTYFVTVSCQ